MEESGLTLDRAGRSPGGVRDGWNPPADHGEDKGWGPCPCHAEWNLSMWSRGAPPRRAGALNYWTIYVFILVICRQTNCLNILFLHQCPFRINYLTCSLFYHPRVVQ